MVELLLVAHNYDGEQSLGRYVLNNYEQGKRISIEMCRQMFGSGRIDIPDIVSHEHQISDYDSLLRGLHG